MPSIAQRQNPFFSHTNIGNFSIWGISVQFKRWQLDRDTTYLLSVQSNSTSLHLTAVLFIRSIPLYRYRRSRRCCNHFERLDKIREPACLHSHTTHGPRSSHQKRNFAMSPFNETLLDGPSSPQNDNDNNNHNQHNDHLVVPSHTNAPLDGSAITESINFRRKMGQRPVNNTAMRMRPPSDIPSASSSGSTIQPPPQQHQLQRSTWTGGGEKHQHAQPRQVPRASSDYPVQQQIREVMERSEQLERQQKRQQIKRQKQQRKQRLAYEQHPHHTRAHAREVAKEDAHRHRREMIPFDDGGGNVGGIGNGGGKGKGKGDANVIHGLHMDHFLNDQYHEGHYYDTMSSPTSLSPPLSPRFERYGAWSPLPRPRPSSSSLPPNPNNLPINLTNNHMPINLNSNLPPNTIDHTTGEYVIEGSFQTKGCIVQTADDVGYLFGCGTKPQDEVVYVYNTTKAVDTAEPTPAAKADERNLWYHMGPDYDVRNRMDADVVDAVGGVGGGGVGGDNINDVLFQIDREYLTMKAAHEGNMGLVNYSTAAANNVGGNNNEFLRDPPPPPPHGHYRVVHEEDVNGSAKSNGCGLMNFIMPASRRDTHDQPRDDHHIDNNNNNNNSDPTFNYQPNINHLRESEEKYYYTNYFCSHSGRKERQQRQQQPPPPPQPQQHTQHPASPSSQSTDGSTSSFEKAKKGVVELQNQLKAMVHVRAMRQQQQHGNTMGGGSGSGNGHGDSHPKETRQESTNTPLSSPPHSTSTIIMGNHNRNQEQNEANNTRSMNAEEEDAKQQASEARLSSAKADIERLRYEATSLDRARQSLQYELADHQQKMTDMVNATHRDEREWEMERLKDERKREAERLNEKERSLEASREMLRRELKEHREKMAVMNATNAMNAATTQYNSQLQQQQQVTYNSALMNDTAAALLSPTAAAAMGCMPGTTAAPLSPLTAMASSMLPGMMTSEQIGNIGMAPPPSMPMNDGMGNVMGMGTGNHALNTGMNSGMNNRMSTGMMGNGMNVGANNGMNTYGSGMNNVSMGNYTNNGMGNVSGMMGNNNMNNGTSHGGELLKQRHQHQQHYTSRERADPPSQREVNSILKDPNSILDPSIITGGYQNRYANNDGKTTVASKSIFSGGGPSLRSEGKFIDNVGGIGASYNLRPQVSPKTRRSLPSRPNQIQPRDPQPSPQYQTRDPQPSRPHGRAMPRSYPAHSNRDELSQSNTMLHELKVKNKLINQDIMRIKKSMSTRNGGKSGSPKNRSPSNYHGGADVASGVREGHATKPSLRPFPRTSPPSSPKESYGYQEDPSPRVLRRGDDARSQRVFNFSGGTSGSPHLGNQHNQYQPSGHHRPSLSQDRHRVGRGGGGHQQQGGYAKQQPAYPMRSMKEQGQTY